MDIITRQQSKSQQLKHYFTGIPCINGHMCRRWTSSGGCEMCLTKHMRSNAVKHEIKAKLYRQANKQHIARKNAEWRTANPDALKLSRKNNYSYEKCVARYQRTRDRRLFICKLYRENNRAKYAALSAKRRAQMRQATPSWFNPDIVEQFYVEAMRLTSELGIPYEVDHVIPIQSKKVCGLHCQFNLQVIPASENRTKSNKFIIE